MCLFLVLDSLLSYITCFVPFFQVLKLVTVLWLSLPMFNGPTFIYNFYMKRVFVHFEDDIDAQLEMARKKFMDAIVVRFNQAYGKCQKYNGKLLGFNGKVKESSEEKVEKGAYGDTKEKVEEMEENIKKDSSALKENFSKFNSGLGHVENAKDKFEKFGGRLSEREDNYEREDKKIDGSRSDEK